MRHATPRSDLSIEPTALAALLGTTYHGIHAQLDLEHALAQLRAQQATHQRFDPGTLHACAQLVWEYFVQREACGLADQTRVIELLGIPNEVLR